MATLRSADETRELEWSTLKRKMAAVLPPFEERTSGPSPYFNLDDGEKEMLRGLLVAPPATRSYPEVRSLLNLLRGSDLLLQLDDDTAATVAGSMRLIEYGKGDVIGTETNAQDGFLLVVEGQCTVLIRDVSVRPPRAPLFHLYPGECFSEQALVENSRRAPSLVAAEDVTLLRVGRTDFLAALASWHLELLERKTAALHAVPAFITMPRRLLRPLAERMAQERCHAKTVLISQGEEPSKLFVIASGEARVLLRGEDGELITISTLGPGSLFGEIGAIKGTPHTASVVSQTDMTLYTVPKADLLAGADPGFIERLTQMAEEYPTEEEHMKSLHLRHHWLTYKQRMVQDGHAELTNQAFKIGTLIGGRPPLPPSKSNRPIVHEAVMEKYTIAMDGTPISNSDLDDMAAHARRREKDAEWRQKPFDPQLVAYLATKPGGTLWTGNAYLRAYVAKEEKREEAMRSRRARRKKPEELAVAASSSSRLQTPMISMPFAEPAMPFTDQFPPPPSRGGSPTFGMRSGASSPALRGVSAGGMGSSRSNLHSSSGRPRSMQQRERMSALMPPNVMQLPARMGKTTIPNVPRNFMQTNVKALRSSRSAAGLRGTLQMPRLSAMPPPPTAPSSGPSLAYSTSAPTLYAERTTGFGVQAFVKK